MSPHVSLCLSLLDYLNVLTVCLSVSHPVCLSMAVPSSSLHYCVCVRTAVHICPYWSFYFSVCLAYRVSAVLYLCTSLYLSIYSVSLCLFTYAYCSLCVCMRLSAPTPLQASLQWRGAPSSRTGRQSSAPAVEGGLVNQRLVVCLTNYALLKP